jgi:hypothetical protein
MEEEGTKRKEEGEDIEKLSTRVKTYEMRRNNTEVDEEAEEI